MARNQHPPELFESIAKDLSDGVTTLKSIAAAIRDSGMPHALIHSSSTTNVYVPALLDWIEKANADVKTQIRAYLAGVKSSAEFHKEKTAIQKLAASKKPFNAKAKKKAT